MKQSKWPVVRFADILERVDRKIVLDDVDTYDCVGVRWYGLGTFIRESKLGMDIRRKKQWIIREGDVVYNKLFAWKGAFAIADAGVDGCIVSDKFPTYKLDEEQVDPQYLRYYFRIGWIAQQAGDLSKGAAAISKLTLNPPDFWKLTIPLPPIDQQQRVVARIEELAVLTEEAQALRGKAREEAGVLFDSTINLFWRNQGHWTVEPIGEIASIVSGQVDPTVEPYASMPHINGAVIESGTCRLLPFYQLAKEDGVTSGKYHFKPGAVLYSKIRPYLRKAVQVSFEGVCSADIYAFDNIDPALAPRFFMYSLIAPQFTEYANSLSGRTRMPKLNRRQLFAFEMAYPSLVVCQS